MFTQRNAVVAGICVGLVSIGGGVGFLVNHYWRKTKKTDEVADTEAKTK